jgi:hypothetical protein
MHASVRRDETGGREEKVNDSELPLSTSTPLVHLSSSTVNYHAYIHHERSSCQYEGQENSAEEIAFLHSIRNIRLLSLLPIFIPILDPILKQPVSFSVARTPHCQSFRASTVYCCNEQAHKAPTKVRI